MKRMPPNWPLVGGCMLGSTALKSTNMCCILYINTVQFSPINLCLVLRNSKKVDSTSLVTGHQGIATMG